MVKVTCPPPGLLMTLFVIFHGQDLKVQLGGEECLGWEPDNHFSAFVTGFCWLHQTVTFSIHWGELRPSLKQLGRVAASRDVRPSFTTGKQ